MKFDPRLKMNLDELVNSILDDMDQTLFERDDTTFCDPKMAGGQFIKHVEARLRDYGHSDRNINRRVFGFAENLLDIGWATKTHGLVGQFLTDNYLEQDMKFTVTLGNPPFSEIAGGVEGAKKTKQNPLYHRFFEKAAESSEVVAMICPKTEYAKRGFIVDYNNLINEHAQVIKDCSMHFNVRVETNYIIWEKDKDPKDQVPTMQNIQEENPLPEFKRGDHYMRFTSSNHPGIYDKKKNKNCRRVVATINKKDGVVYNWADLEVVKGKTFSSPYLVVMACCLQHGGHFHNAQVIETKGERMFADVNIAVWEFTSKRAANKLKNWLNSDEFRDIQLSLPWFRGRTSDLRMLPNVG